MNNVTKIMVIVFVFVPTLQANLIKLESTILAHADGLFPIGINGDVIALIKQYQNQMTSLLRGKKTVNGYEGVFEFAGKKMTVQELRQLECEQGTNSNFIAMRHRIIDEFEHISRPFRELIKEFGIKPLMRELIEESTLKRNRHDSLLNIWARTDEKNEYELFDKHIKSIKDIEIFMIDLNNFLGDIVYSCPRGSAQFKEQLDKFNKAAQLAKELHLSKERHDLFLKHVNTKLTTISKSEISLAIIKELYNDFKPSAV